MQVSVSLDRKWQTQVTVGDERSYIDNQLLTFLFSPRSRSLQLFSRCCFKWNKEMIAITFFQKAFCFCSIIVFEITSCSFFQLFVENGCNFKKRRDDPRSSFCWRGVKLIFLPLASNGWLRVYSLSVVFTFTLMSCLACSLSSLDVIFFQRLPAENKEREGDLETKETET